MRTSSVPSNREVTKAGKSKRGAPGKFSFQLILDNGAEEYVLRPTSEDADVLVDLFEQTDTIYFDMERGVLIFGDVSTD
jgi:hypothetical protein